MLGFNIIEEYGRKQKHLFQENITLFYGSFGGNNKTCNGVKEMWIQ
jgi:hypothetical protein